MNKRPLIDDTPGQPAHPMTDEQYAEYLKMQEEIPSPAPSLEDRVAQTESNVASLQSEMDDIGYIVTGKERTNENS